MRVVFLFGVPFILVLFGFGFLLKMEYGWIKNCDKNTSKLKQIVLWLSTISTALVGLCVTMALGSFFIISVAMQLEAMDQAKIVNLNSNIEELSVGDVWNVDDLGSVSINYIEELSADEAKEQYRIDSKETERYFELSFDYENIAFDGYLLDGKVVDDAMKMSVYVSSEDSDGNSVEAWLDTIDEKNFYYANQGIMLKDNKFLMIADRLENLHFIEV
ncbi:MAG: hypothetical protein IJ936_02435, partial [Peptococcaceae bacterium]|nr:hypothetical protein [Peptococcaceae bacterium]